MIGIWTTGHDIADTVAHACLIGLGWKAKLLRCGIDDVNAADIHIGYGILRGMADVFKQCDVAGKPWFNIDRGYFGAGHFNGYYRVSYRNTQQVDGLFNLPIRMDRYKKLGIVLENREPVDGPVLICPPTDYVREWLNVQWCGGEGLLREKGCTRNLDDDLKICSSVKTFNSSVGWEALRRGINVESDKDKSILGKWKKNLANNRTLVDTRRELFGVMAGLQLTLNEIKEGSLWPLMESLLSISDGIAEKP